jgi:ADP-ribosyl-[dinitrogen reductase] hydrolase
MKDYSDRLRGIAVGAAVGDALGMALEFKPASSIYNLLTEMLPGALPAGSFTDDTEMALALAESLQHANPLDARDLAGRFAGWFQSHPADVGISTAKVLRLISQGLSWEEASQKVCDDNPDSAPNGALMRCWPLAVARYQNLALLVAETRLQSEVTHKNPDAVNAAILLNLILRKLTLRESSTPPGAALRAAIVECTSQVTLTEEFSLAISLAPMRSRDDLKNSGWVLHTMESALWAVLTTQSFEEALVQAVNLGNDADTTGSVTGALAGAMYGLSGIPARWKDLLHGEYPLKSGRIWLTQDFIDLADQLSVLPSEM